MRKAETTSKKLLLLPVIPALVLGIVELATPAQIPFSAPVPVCVERESVPPPVVAIDEPPQMAPETGGCSSCTASL